MHAFRAQHCRPVLRSQAECFGQNGSRQRKILARTQLRISGCDTNVVAPDVIVLTLVSPQKNARVHRLVNVLENLDLQVTILGPGAAKTQLEMSVRRFLARSLIWGATVLKVGRPRVLSLIVSVFFRMLRHRNLLKQFQGTVIVEDVLLTPLLFSLSPNVRTLVDVRDLSHRLYEHRKIWRLTFGRALKELMQVTLSESDAVFTVSEGLAAVLREDFSIQPSVVRSIPDIPPRARDSGEKKRPLRLVYMGRADENRRLDLLIKACAGLDQSLRLDLYLVGHRSDMRRLEQLGKRAKNVVFRETVPMLQIVDTLEQYDCGYVAYPPTIMNLAYALPNKFFEYLAAGIPVIVNSGSEMARIVEEYSCGVVVDSSSPLELRKSLESLDAGRLLFLEEGVKRAQNALNWSEESAVLKDLLLERQL